MKTLFLLALILAAIGPGMILFHRFGIFQQSVAEAESNVMDRGQAIEVIRPAIVQIILLSSKPARFPMGTGFFINRDAYIVTARHVLQGAAEIARTMQLADYHLRAGIGLENTESVQGIFVAVEFDVVDTDELHDLALLKLRRNPFKGEVTSGFRIGDRELPLPLGEVTLDPRQPKDGTPIGVSGFPFGEPVLVTNGGWIGSSWATVSKNIPDPSGPPGATTPRMVYVYIADISANPGNSGGPVYLVNGVGVIGVCVAGRGGRGTGLTVVVPSRDVIEFLKKNGVAWTQR